MRENPVKKKLKEGKPSIGSFLIVDNPATGEIMADVGFEWLAIDGEHAQFTIESMRTVMLAMSRTPVVSMVRVAWNDPVRIKEILDIGPEGIIIPMVSTAEEARAAVQACRYPPEGIRGFGVARAQRYGATTKEYFDSANENLLISIQIESIEGVRNIDEILSVEGIDCLYLGWADLGGSMGIRSGGEVPPEVWREMDKVFVAAKKAKVPAGLWVGSPEEAAKWVKKGCQFISLGSDVSYLVKAAQQSYTRCLELIGAKK